MEPGETIVVVASRELAKESGFSAWNTIVIGYFYTHNRLSDQKQHIVLCEDLFEHNLASDPDEFIKTHWLARDEINAKITGSEFDNINLLAALNVWSRSEQ